MHKYFNPKNYFLFVFNRIINLSSPLLRLWEETRISRYGNQPLKHQPIFIIGAPRTGSTILYQMLTNIYDVLYIDNLTCLLHKNLVFGFWLSNKLYKNSPHNNFRADHGNTLKYGLHAPSECGQFWYRWLPTDHHCIDFDEITDEMVEEIRQEITAVINYWDRPLVFKNLNAGQRLRLLHRCFPKAKFIYIKREPFYTAQSILSARRENRIAAHEMWSIKPKNYKELETMPELDMIAGQIYSLEKQIEKDMHWFGSNQFLSLWYEDMVNDFPETLKQIEVFSGVRLIGEKHELSILHNGNQVRVSADTRDGIEEALRHYDF